MILRGRAIATVPEALMRAQADVEVQVCVVCQDEMNEPSAVATLPCGHCFHNTCIIGHLRHDGRCPTCRHNPALSYEPSEPALPYYDPTSDDSDEDEASSGPTIPEALKIARVAAKTDARVKKSFATLRKWNQEATDTRKKMRAAYDKLRPLEAKFAQKLEKYTQKMWKTFDCKNKHLLETVDNNTKRLRKAYGCIRTTRIRIAKKHGFVPPPKHSSCTFVRTGFFSDADDY